jgi:SAM-dependent methyltransferase
MPSNVAFYNMLAGDYHLFFHDLEQNMEEEGDWLDAVLRPRGVNTILDACCGTGRQAIPLAKRGFHVTGSDPSRPMLRYARREAERSGIEIRLLQGAFEEMPELLQQRFDAVIAMGNGLCNLETPEGILRALQALHSCCDDGGTCLIGVKDFHEVRKRPDPFLGRSLGEGVEGRRILFDVWEVKEPHLVSTSFVLKERGGRWHTRSASTREYMLEEHELGDLASRAGFRDVRRLNHHCEAAFILTA